MFILPNPIQRIILAISGPLSGTTSGKTATFIQPDAAGQERLEIRKEMFNSFRAAFNYIQAEVSSSNT